MYGRAGILPSRSDSRSSLFQGSSAGVRDDSGRLIPYLPDSLRVPSSRFIPNGYLRTGYDTGRIW